MSKLRSDNSKKSTNNTISILRGSKIRRNGELSIELDDKFMDSEIKHLDDIYVFFFALSNYEYWSSEIAQNVADKIIKNKNVVSLNFSNDWIKDEQCVILIEALKFSQSIAKIEFGTRNYPYEASIIALQETIRFNNVITDLEFGVCIKDFSEEYHNLLDRVEKVQKIIDENKNYPEKALVRVVGNYIADKEKGIDIEHELDNVLYEKFKVVNKELLLNHLKSLHLFSVYKEEIIEVIKNLNEKLIINAEQEYLDNKLESGYYKSFKGKISAYLGYKDNSNENSSIEVDTLKLPESYYQQKLKENKIEPKKNIEEVEVKSEAASFSQFKSQLKALASAEKTQNKKQNNDEDTDNLKGIQNANPEIVLANAEMIAEMRQQIQEGNVVFIGEQRDDIVF